ncbi:MAG: GNAT family N-acetyltransferase [Alkalispirochaeta sp.]
MKDLVIRGLEPTHSHYLPHAVHLSIHVPDNEGAAHNAPDRGIVQSPPFLRTFENWGRPGDLGTVALLSGRDSDDIDGSSRIIGAAWLRLYTPEAPTYGFVSPDVPTLVIAVEPIFRGNGVGTELLTHLIANARRAGFPAISLSVDPGNPAVRLYRRLGFRDITAPRYIPGDEHPVMLLPL